jgi:hypothetical protein
MGATIAVERVKIPQFPFRKSDPDACPVWSGDRDAWGRSDR